MLRNAEKVPSRQNINDLTQEQLYLYLEGLKKFQHVPANNPLSYFQIAGEKALDLPVTAKRRRNSWTSVPEMAQRRVEPRYPRRSYTDFVRRILYSFLDPIPDMASPVFGLV